MKARSPSTLAVLEVSWWTGEQTLEWVTPVLYLRTDDTRLFTLTVPPAGPQPAAEPPAGEQVAREATLYGLYVQALAALRTDRHDQAITLLDSLLTLDPTYRDAARQTHRLATGYQRARAAEDAGDWTTAARHYAEIIAVDPGYRDAAARRDACRHWQEIASLQDELRLHASTHDWPAVLAVNEQLAALDPAAADPDGLATTAREQLARCQEAEQVVIEEQARREAEEGAGATAKEERSDARQSRATGRAIPGTLDTSASDTDATPPRSAVSPLGRSARMRIIAVCSVVALVASIVIAVTLTSGTNHGSSGSQTSTTPATTATQASPSMTTSTTSTPAPSPMDVLLVS